MSLPQLSVKRPITVLMIFFALAVIGVLSLMELPVELMPNTTYRKITIYVGVRGGMPPEEVENLVTRPIEEAVGSISHLRSIRSISRKERSEITLEFEPGADMDFASLDVREKFARIRHKLPEDIEKPVIANYEETDKPILTMSITSNDIPLTQLKNMVDTNVKDLLLRVDGVANIKTYGGGSEQRKIFIDASLPKLQTYGLGMQDITQAINVNNQSYAVGDITRQDQRLMIRAIGHYRSIEEIEETILRGNEEGQAVLRIKDVAVVRDSQYEPESLSRTNGEDVISLQVQRESSANTIQVIDMLHAALKPIREVYRAKGVSFEEMTNQATIIREYIRSVKSSLLIGAGLSMIILFVFLRNLRSTFVMIIVLPLSVVMTFACMYFQGRWLASGLSINTMTLSGLALGIGMLIDNAVVVLENIYQKYTRSMDAIQGAIHGGNEMLLAIMASTATSVIVFLPLMFVNDDIKQFYAGLSLTVTYALLVSLFVAVTVVPCYASRFIRYAKETSFHHRKRVRYDRGLSHVLRHRYLYLGGMLVFFVLSLILVSKMDRTLLGATDEGEFTIFAELDSGAKLDVSNELVREIEAVLDVMPEVKDYTSHVEPTKSQIQVTLVPSRERSVSAQELIDQLREITDDIETNYKKGFIHFSEEQSAGGKKEIEINLYGHSYDVLKKMAEEMATHITHVPGLHDPKMKRIEGRPELRLYVDKEKAALMGYTTQALAEAVHAQLRGYRASTLPGEHFDIGSQELEIVTRLTDEDRRNFEAIRQLSIPSKGHAQDSSPSSHGQEMPPIFLRQLVRYAFDDGPSEIYRKNKQRTFHVSANIGDHALGGIVNDIKKALKDFQSPKDYYYEFGEQYQRMMRNQRELKFAGIITLILVYMVLAALFESYVQPFIIMFSVMFAFIGGTLVLWARDVAISMSVMIGAIMLFGIVVNNGIVMVDHINTLRKKEGHSCYRAVMEGAVHRARPILMTSLTTIFGMIPMALDRGDGAALWSPLALTVIGGMTTATFLTMFLLPGVYLVFEDIAEGAKSVLMPHGNTQEKKR